jgi:hypothetical protein
MKYNYLGSQVLRRANDANSQYCQRGVILRRLASVHLATADARVGRPRGVNNEANHWFT